MILLRINKKEKNVKESGYTFLFLLRFVYNKERFLFACKYKIRLLKAGTLWYNVNGKSERKIAVNMSDFIEKD